MKTKQTGSIFVSGNRFTHRSGPCSGATQRLDDFVPLASFGGHNYQMVVGAMGEHTGKGVLRGAMGHGVA